MAEGHWNGPCKMDIINKDGEWHSRKSRACIKKGGKKGHRMGNLRTCVGTSEWSCAAGVESFAEVGRLRGKAILEMFLGVQLWGLKFKFLQRMRSHNIKRQRIDRWNKSPKFSFLMFSYFYGLICAFSFGSFQVRPSDNRARKTDLICLQIQTQQIQALRFMILKRFIVCVPNALYHDYCY